MENKFASNNLAPLGFCTVFTLVSVFVLFSEGFSASFMVPAVLAAFFLFNYAYLYTVYVVTDDEFYIANAWGTKLDSVLFNEEVKIYTLNGTTFQGDFFGNIDSYAVDILKMQTTSGRIFKLDMNMVFSQKELIDALREKLQPHMVEA